MDTEIYKKNLLFFQKINKKKNKNDKLNITINGNTLFIFNYSNLQ